MNYNWWELSKVSCHACADTFHIPRYVQRTFENDEQWEFILKALKFCNNCLLNKNEDFIRTLKRRDDIWREYTSSGIAPYIQDVELLNSYRDSHISGGKLTMNGASKVLDTFHFLDPKSRNLILPSKKDARSRQSFGLFM